MSREITGLDMLESVLCDPEGACCIAGSEGDRRVIDEALGILRASLAKSESLTAEAVAREAARWREAVTQFQRAQGRMRDRWAESDDYVKAELWRDLHAWGNRCREILDQELHKDEAALWIAQHDASVVERAVRPWREAVERVLLDVDDDGRAEAHDVAIHGLRALLTPAAQTKEGA